VLTAGRAPAARQEGRRRCSSRCVRGNPLGGRQRFEEAAAENRFSVLGVHDVGERLRAKGLQFDRKFYVYEVCNPWRRKSARHERPDRNRAAVPGLDLYGRRRSRPRDVEATAMMAMFGEPTLDGPPGDRGVDRSDDGRGGR